MKNRGIKRRIFIPIAPLMKPFIGNANCRYDSAAEELDRIKQKFVSIKKYF